MSESDSMSGKGRAEVERPLALFVYGTLAPGEVNAHVLSALDGSWTRAKVGGVLCDVGWGAAHGFPGMRLLRCASSSDDAPSNFVSGLLFESEGLRELWPELDDFEGADYCCELTQAIFEDGTTKPCVVYAVDVVE
ncbi:MAG: gamma-glutamylcyclotransferase family protein [Halieaceae bacterium]